MHSPLNFTGVERAKFGLSLRTQSPDVLWFPNTATYRESKTSTGSKTISNFILTQTLCLAVNQKVQKWLKFVL